MERLAKNDYGLEILPEDITIFLQRCKYRRTLEYPWVLNMPQVIIVSGFRMCQGS